MKKSNYHILFARLLLFFFVAGQAMLYAHQHNITTPVSKAPSHSPQQTVTEKCQLCDAMHFNSMALSHQVYFQPAVPVKATFIPETYSFISLSLILSAGRSPPLL